MPFQRKHLLRWSLLLAALLLVGLVRFNRHDLLLPNPAPGDSTQYRLYVQYFRGADVAARLRIASTWRPLTPLLAAALPFSPMTALNVVNLMALALTLPFLLRTTAALTKNSASPWIGGWLFVCSFPTLYYSTIGYVDPLLILFLAAGVFLILRERWMGLGLLIVVGTAAKEGIVILIPATAAYVAVQRSSKPVLLAGLYLVLYAVVTVAIHRWAPGAAHTQFWKPSTWRIIDNAARFHAWASVGLSFGVPGLLTCWTLARARRLPGDLQRRIAPLAAGFATAMATCAFAFVSASVDGRTVWAAYPFAIPLGLIAVERWLLPQWRGTTRSAIRSP